VWSFAEGKTPEGIVVSRQFLRSAKLGFVRSKKMRLNYSASPSKELTNI
jgi:hypothetical protein